MGSISNVNGNAVPEMSVALNPCDFKNAPGYIQEINRLGSATSLSDPAVRFPLLQAARRLVSALETPRETMIKHCWSDPCVTGALCVGIDTGLFKVMLRGSGSSKKAADLAAEVGVETSVIARILRHLAAMGYVVETGPDEYKPTNFTSSLTIPIIGDGYLCCSGRLLEAPDRLFEYLKTHGGKIADDMADGPLQYAYDTKLNMFQYLEAVGHLEHFNHHMGGYRQGRPSWMDPGFFDVKNRLIDGADTSSDSVFLVDVGGNLGHDLQEFLNKYPEVPGRLVLQDVPVVIEAIEKLDKRIERMSYDFYTEQPMKGSRAYYLHSVLHDWSDELCLEILGRITAAMKPDYSRLLINENVIPPTQADWQMTGLDMMMMTLLSSRERTEGDWRTLLTAAGLKIVKIWNVESTPGVESLIECELA